jgi:hypothetical protein
MKATIPHGKKATSIAHMDAGGVNAQKLLGEILRYVDTILSGKSFIMSSIMSSQFLLFYP